MHLNSRLDNRSQLEGLILELSRRYSLTSVIHACIETAYLYAKQQPGAAAHWQEVARVLTHAEHLDSPRDKTEAPGGIAGT